MRFLFWVLPVLAAATAHAQIKTIGSFDVAASGSQYVVLYSEMEVTSSGYGPGRVYGEVYDSNGVRVGDRVEIDAATPGDQVVSQIVCGSETCLIRLAIWDGQNNIPYYRLLTAGSPLWSTTAVDPGVNLFFSRGAASPNGFEFAVDVGGVLKLVKLNKDGTHAQTVNVPTTNFYKDGPYWAIPGEAGTVVTYASDWQNGGNTRRRLAVLNASGGAIGSYDFGGPHPFPMAQIVAFPGGWRGWFATGASTPAPVHPFVVESNGFAGNLPDPTGPIVTSALFGWPIFDGRDIILTRNGCPDAPNPGACLDYQQALIARMQHQGLSIDSDWVGLSEKLPAAEPTLASIGNGNAFAAWLTREDEQGYFVHRLNTASLVRGSAGAGGACDTGSDCAEGFCSGGVCCNSPCEGTCQTCRASEGSTADGVCTTRAAAAVCRAAAHACDAPETCDGTSIQCPGDVMLSEGATCDDGNAATTGDVCQANVCVGGGASDGGNTTDGGVGGYEDAGSDGGVFIPPPQLPPPDDEDDKGCDGCSASGSGIWALGAGLWALRRRRSFTRGTDAAERSDR